MKALILSILFVVVSVSSTCGQISLFGINLSKYLNAEESLMYRKMNCWKNSFYTFAEYKNYPAKNIKFIMFDDFMTIHETAQMRDPEKYIVELSEEISKTLGKSFKVFRNESMTSPVEDQYFWIVKQGDKYMVAKLFYSTFSQRNNLRIFMYSSSQELIKGFETLTMVENKKEVMFYDLAVVIQKL